MLWKNINTANTAIPKNIPTFFGHANNAYANEKVFIANTSVAEAHNGIHQGWVSHRPGEGRIVSVVVANSGTSYANGETLTYTGTKYSHSNTTFYTSVVNLKLNIIFNIQSII